MYYVIAINGINKKTGKKQKMYFPKIYNNIPNNYEIGQAIKKVKTISMGSRYDFNWKKDYTTKIEKIKN